MSAPRSDTWMPLYIGDYLRDTQHLSRDEHGAYLLLLMACWVRGGWLPSDDRQLAAIAKATPAEWRRLKPVIAPFFTEGDPGITQGRLAKELAKAKRNSEVKAANGKKGGRPKADEKANGKLQVSGDEPKPKLTETPSPSPSPSPSESSDANASGAEAPGPLDLKREMWARGKAFLVSKGLSADEAGKMIGRWRKSASDTAIIDALARAEADCQGDVIEYVAGCLRGANGRGSQQAASAKAGLFTGFAIAASGRRPES